MSVFLQAVMVIAAMVLVGILMGYLAGLIWKGQRPIGVRGDYIAAILATVIMGLIDWFLIPAMGFSNTIRLAGIIFEPALTALLVLWVIRKSRE